MTECIELQTPESVFEEVVLRSEKYWWHKMDLYGPSEKPDDGPNMLELRIGDNVLGYIVLEEGVEWSNLSKMQTAEGIVDAGIGHHSGQFLTTIALNARLASSKLPNNVQLNSRAGRVKDICTKARKIWNKEEGQDDFVFRKVEDDSESDHTVQVFCQDEELGRWEFFPHSLVGKLPQKWMQLLRESKDMPAAIQAIAEVKYYDLSSSLIALKIQTEEIFKLGGKKVKQNEKEIKPALKGLKVVVDNLKRASQEDCIISEYVRGILKINL